MRDGFKLSVTIAIIVFLFSGAARADTGFRVSAAMSRISFDDYNDMVDTINEDLSLFQAEAENLNWLPELGGEFFYSPFPLVSVGAGAGMIFGGAELSTQGIGNYEYGVRSYPLTLTGYFKPDIPLMPVKPYAYLGVGAYYASIDFDFSYSEQGIKESADLSAWGFGFHGGAGLEFSILPLVSLEVGLRGRWVDIEGFEGTGKLSDGTTTEVFLISDTKEVDFGGERIEYPVFGPEPVENRDKYDEGSLNLSGYGILFGLKLAF